MATTLVIICLFLVTHLHAGSITRSSTDTFISTSTTDILDSSLSSLNSTTSSSVFDVDEELAKIAASCLTRREHEQLSDNSFKYGIASSINENLMKMAVEIIGLTELRAVLGFAPPGPWTNYNDTEPSAEEIASATTVEDYYNLREPRNEWRSLDSDYFFEKNLPPAIAFLDKRFPAIRKIFRNTFEENLRLDEGRTIDRKTVDDMIDEFRAIRRRVLYATFEVLPTCPRGFPRSKHFAYFLRRFIEK